MKWSEVVPSVTGVENTSRDHHVCKVCDDSRGLDVSIFTIWSLSSSDPVHVSPSEKINQCSLERLRSAVKGRLCINV